MLNMYDTEFRPQIIQRPVTILRRAESTQSSNDPNFIDKSKAATKSFKSYEQRQQEYAQARYLKLSTKSIFTFNRMLILFNIAFVFSDFVFWGPLKIRKRMQAMMMGESINSMKY
jgi:hypothetical protein